MHMTPARTLPAISVLLFELYCLPVLRVFFCWGYRRPLKTPSGNNDERTTNYFAFHREKSTVTEHIQSSTMTKAAAVQSSSTPFVVDRKTIMEGDIVKMSLEVPTKGRNVSGRSWKVRPQKRASTLIKTKTNNQTKSFQERLREKNTRKEILEVQAELREERRQGKVLKKERRLENVKRRAENELKQAQKSAKQLNLGKLPSKLKAMSKKQLRQIKKTRLNPKTGVVEYVPAYSK